MALPERRLESEDELLTGADGFRMTPRRRRVLIRALAVVLAAAAAAVAISNHHPGKPSPYGFQVEVVAADYAISAQDTGLDTVLTLGNRGTSLVAVTGAAVRQPGVADEHAVTASLAIAPGGSQVLALHGDFLCTSQALAPTASVTITGTAADGSAHDIVTSVPANTALPIGVAAIRDLDCNTPFPLAFADLSYGGLIAVSAPGTFSMTVSLTVQTAFHSAPIQISALSSDVPGTRAELRGGLPVAAAPGTPVRLTLDWTVTDCSAIPAYNGIPAVSATAANARATETRYFALGPRYAADLARELASVCP